MHKAILFGICLEASVSLYYAYKLKSKKERNIKTGMTILGVVILLFLFK